MGTWIICIAAAYLIGSIPFGYLIARSKGVNIREHGSGNIGATNVSRVIGRGAGRACFLLDVAKGAVPTLVAGIVNGVLGQDVGALTLAQQWWWLGVPIAAVLGHMFSIFLGFKGGKGVATGFGGFVSMWPILTIPVLGALVVWYATLRVTKYVSLASIAAAVAIPVGFALAELPNVPIANAYPPIVVTGLLALLILWKHRGNLIRIKRGEEPKADGTSRRGDVLESG